MENHVSFCNIPDSIRKIKIDIGLSYSCPHSQNWLENDENLYVFGFEPNNDCIRTIKEGNIKKRHVEHGEPISDFNLKNNFCLIPVALGNPKSEGITEVNFYQMKNDCGTSSVYPPVDINLGPIDSVIKTRLYSLKNFFDIFDWNRFPYIEYIKIDAQGSDYNIILGAGEYLKDRVVYITAEPENRQYDGADSNTTENMRIYLESQGFIQVYDRNTSDPTFLNKKFQHLKDDIYIYQCG